jgi:MFS transporter, PAT family, beta-lactamase induction signal transducer AmpG
MTSDKFLSILRVIMSARMLVALMMGFSCGLPLMLTMTVLQAWMKAKGVDLSLIGLMSLVGIPYTLKFLWAPVMDRFTLPFLGRRRGWLFMAQSALILAVIGLGHTDPARHPEMVAAVAFLVTFFSATQDIIVDAYRREDIPDAELGFATSLYINGYRIGMLLASGGGLILADRMSFAKVYLIMAACLIPGVITTLLAPEPKVNALPPKTLKAAVIEPLSEYFNRSGAFWILGFILLYKIGDSMATSLTTPYYLEIGYSNTEIGAVVKLFGFWATIAGAFAGGVLTLRLGIYGSLWTFGVLQAISNACFALLIRIGHSIPALAGVIGLENLCNGMGTVAFAAFMAMLTDKRFTATQYALLTSLMGVPRVLAAAPTGYLAKYLGWEYFFIFCALIAIPGLLILLKAKSGGIIPAQSAEALSPRSS